jgi:hypothetical protein
MLNVPAYIIIFRPFAYNLSERNIRPTNKSNIGWIFHPLPWMKNSSKTKIISSDELPYLNRLINHKSKF